MKKIIVTGGAGYIGSHVVKSLLKKGYEVFVIDDLSYGSERLALTKNFLKADIADKKKVSKLLKEFKPDAVMHFAAFKDAAESVLKPEKYFLNNTAKTIAFLDCLMENNVNNLIFSSTAAVYGDVGKAPIEEDFELKPTNPYGMSKLMVEEILDEYRKAGKLKSISFRYFNVGGTDSEGEIGNLYPNPTDVISVLLETAAGKRPQFEIFGTDYETKDGSCVRDLIHVEDLASAHVKGLEKLLAEGVTGVFNLGSESGYTIRELVDMAEKVTGKNFKVVEVGRRPGDIIISIASSEKAKRILGWEPTKTLEDILLTSWKWEINGKQQ